MKTTSTITRAQSHFAIYGIPLALLLLVGCTQGNEREFDYRLVEEVPFNIEVQASEQPLRGALVQIGSGDYRSVSGEEEADGTVFFTGFTDGAGHVEGAFNAPLTASDFWVIVHARGYVGPYASSDLQNELGAFAPSSWQERSASKLDGLTVPLQLRAPTLARILEPGSSAVAPPEVDEENAVPTAVLDSVGETLPEFSNAGAAFLGSSFDTNLHVLESGEVKLLFLHEGAGYRNSLGYFTYSVDTDGSTIIEDSNLVWPNASLVNAGGDFEPGFTSYLRGANGEIRTFEAGDNIGFFLVADGWTGSTVDGWSGPGSLPYTTPSQNAGTRNIYTSQEQFNPERDSSQPERAKHLAIIAMPAIEGFLEGEDYILLGFEDLRRDQGSDDDFNDLVFVVQSNPVEAIDTRGILQNVQSDPDSDDLTGLDDAFPDDSQRAWIDSYPADGFYTLAFEDQYPNKGDADFNDAVFVYRFDRIYRSDGFLKDIVGTMHLVARGAGRDASFALRIAQLPPGLEVTVLVERIHSDGESSSPSSESKTVDAEGNILVELIPSLITALPPLPGQSFTNTLPGVPTQPAASVRVKLTFSSPVDGTQVALPPYDPMLLVGDSGNVNDIHLVGRPPLSDRPTHLPDESGPLSFVDDTHFPWALSLPFDWTFPREKVHVGGDETNDGAYPLFNVWRGASGFDAMDWYEFPSSEPNKVGPSSVTLVPARNFCIGVFNCTQSN